MSSTMPSQQQHFPARPQRKNSECCLVSLIQSSDSVLALPTAHKPTKQMAATAPVPSTSSSAGPLRQPIRIAQPPPPSGQQQQHYASFNRLNQNCTPMTTTFPSNVAADSTTTFAPHYNSVPSLHNKMVHRPNVPSSASSSTLIPHPLQQRRGDSGDSSVMTNHTHKMSYNSLMETAVAQQRQIDANSCELEESRRLISSTIGTATNDKRLSIGQQVVGLKNRIAHDEREMAKLGAVKREARQLAHHNQLQKKELAQLENAYAQDDVQLRKAVDKVDVLRKQLDLLYQRRASAASAAIAQQRKVNGDLANTSASTSYSSNNLQTNGKSSSKSQASGTIKNLSQQQQQLQQRPQASVGPFQFSNLQKENSSIEEELKKLPSYDQIDSAVGNGSTVMITHHHHHAPPSQQQQQHKKSVRAPPPPFPAAPSTLIVPSYKACHSKQEIGNQSNNNHFVSMEEMHEEQRLARGKPDQLSLRADSLTAMKRRSWAQAEGGTQHESENIWRYLVEEQKKGRTHISFADIIAARKPASNASASATITSMTAAAGGGTNSADDKLRYRHSAVATACATLPPSQQTKPRPKPIVDVLFEDDQLDMPATVTTSHSATVSALSSPSKTTPTASYSVSSVQTSAGGQASEPVEVKQPDDEDKVKIDEEHQDLLTAKNSIGVEPVAAAEEANKDQQQFTTTTIEECIMSEEPKQRVMDEQEEGEEEDMDDEPSEFVVIDSAGEGAHEEASSTTTDEASSTISGDEPAFEELSRTASNDANYKGILRTPGKQNHSRRVVFDQIVLFLDVAYEGEYDMLVQLAKNIPDISVANGEGITALHNAICAGNHDIVKFLIDNNADVNALDSDGWSPLHCAASCNNLVMLKQLIENGACVFATTISKTETAANLFDETHEYEAGAEYIELVEKCMGVVNNGKVYAAFSYEAQQEDELSFQEGDELRVLQRNDEQKEDFSDGEQHPPPEDVCWWLCEHTQDTTKKGLVPRNYLSLFPIWRHRHRHNFQNFELPSSNALSNNTITTTKWIECEGDVIVNPSTTTNSSRELSTYA